MSWTFQFSGCARFAIVEGRVNEMGFGGKGREAGGDGPVAPRAAGIVSRSAAVFPPFFDRGILVVSAPRSLALTRAVGSAGLT